MVHSTPASRSLINILNSTSPRTEPRGTPLVTSHQPDGGALSSFSCPGTMGNTLLLPDIFSLRKHNMHGAFPTTQIAHRNTSQQKQEYLFRKSCCFPFQPSCRGQMQEQATAMRFLRLKALNKQDTGPWIQALAAQSAHQQGERFWHHIPAPAACLLPNPAEISYRGTSSHS